MKSDSFVVTVKDDKYNVIDKLELEKYSLKANVDPATGSKQVPSDPWLVGKNILNPKYDPYELLSLLDLYTYHASCVDAVATDSSGVSYTLKPIEDVEPIESEKERFIEVLENSTPSINMQLYRMVYDRRTIGYGAIEVIRESDSKSDIIRLKHIPAQTLRRHTDTKRVKHTSTDGKEVWYVIYDKNYDDDGNLVDVSADTGEFHPYNSLSPSERANELLWTMEYAPGSDYYGRPPIIPALGSISSDISAVKYNNSFFKNYGMPKFAISVVGDFADYDEDEYIDDGEGGKIPNPDYDVTQTLKYRIGQQIKEVIKNPHSAICITIPSEGEEGKVDLTITPLSVQTEEGHFRMLRKDTRDEVLHVHKVDPSRLGIFEQGQLNGTNSQSTMDSYKYGTVAPIRTEIENIINTIGAELGVTSWKFKIEEVAPIDYTKDIQLAQFLFERGAMTIKELIDNFGNKFGLTIEDPDDYYLNARYIANQPLEMIWNSIEENPDLEMQTLLTRVEDTLWSQNNAKSTVEKTTSTAPTESEDKQ